MAKFLSPGVPGPSGQSFTLKGNYANLSAFNAGAGATAGTIGDCWLLESDGSLMVYSSSEGWIDAGDIIGPAGPQGPVGLQGLKGDTGSTGTKGDKGDTGEQGLRGYTGDTGATGAKGDKGDTGAEGAVGPKGDTGLTGPKGDTGNTGAKGDKGDTGAAGADGNPLDFLNVASNIVPAQSNYYTLGTPTKRWADVYLGPNTINIIDQTLATNATISIDNGIFFINGIAQAQLPNVKVTNLTFNDNTVQSTAAVAQVNSDWNATTGKAQILNKPTIPAAQVNSDWNSSSGASQILNKPDIAALAAPTLTTYASTLSSANLAYSGTPTSARYVAMGKMVYVDINVNLATVTNFGSNGIQYFLTLPFTAAHDSLLIGQCTIAGTIYEIGGKVTTGSNSIGLQYCLSNGSNTPNTWEIFTKQKPANMTTSTTFRIAGTFISQ